MMQMAITKPSPAVLAKQPKQKKSVKKAVAERQQPSYNEPLSWVQRDELKCFLLTTKPKK